MTLIKKGEAIRIIRYLNNKNSRFDSSLKLNEDGLWEAEYKREITFQTEPVDHLIKILNKKTYINSLGEKFDVYVVERYINGRFASLFHVIKLNKLGFTGVQYITKSKTHFILCKEARHLLTLHLIRDREEDFCEKLVIDVKEIIMKICDEVDELFKNKIKFLLNKDEKEKAYYYIDKLFKS